MIFFCYHRRVKIHHGKSDEPWFAQFHSEIDTLLIRHPAMLSICQSRMTLRILCVIAISFAWYHQPCHAQLTTWDGRYPIDQIEVTMVYFVPPDRSPLSDWKRRLDYYAKRIEQFHQREYHGQSKLTVKVRDQIFSSKLSTEQLRVGDANQIYFKTMQEVERGLQFGRTSEDIFPILLVMSDINWRPLDDFFRVRPKDGELEFEGNYNQGRHFPGAESGGARAVYWDNVGKGWGLVSADGWRVPYSGSDCVVYHEGVGHAIGLPHTDDANTSVMSHGQYHGWIHESYVDVAQKRRLGWKPKELDGNTLFSKFTAVSSPAVPQPAQNVALRCVWPADTLLSSVVVEIQTRLDAPWVLVKEYSEEELATGSPTSIDLGAFDRPTPVSYRIRANAKDQPPNELMGYFQVRKSESEFPVPDLLVSPDLLGANISPYHLHGGALPSTPLRFGKEIDVLTQLPNELKAVSGDWEWKSDKLESPKAYGARIEFPVEAPREYQVIYVVEPLDEPNGLTLGQIRDGNRFLVLLNYRADKASLNAIENINGQNVGNATTSDRVLFAKNQISQVVCTVRREGVRVEVDAQSVIDWKGDSRELSLSEYWQTPNTNRLFIGAYDCRYRIHRVTLRPIE
jgi:hypothetical protein